VAGTPTQGVLVSDRIGAFLYRPFSSAEQTQYWRKHLHSGSAKQRPLTQPTQLMQGRADNNKHFASCSIKQHLLLT